MKCQEDGDRQGEDCMSCADTRIRELELQNDELRRALKSLDGYLPTLILNPQATYEIGMPARVVKDLRETINGFAEKREGPVTMDGGRLCGEPCRSTLPCELHG